MSERADLPPGVSLSDIPGNSPQDITYDKVLEECFMVLDDAHDVIDGLIEELHEDFEFILTEWMEAHNTKKGYKS